MPNLIENARHKVDEARFFLGQMQRTESTRDPLTAQRSADEEYAYLLSAFLNACYSALAYLKEDKALASDATAFMRSHPDFYRSGADGGWRTRAVHFEPVKPQHDGYVPPPGHNVILNFSDPRPPQSGHNVVLEFGGPSHYYFESGATPQNTIADLCGVHLMNLTQFVDSLAKRIGTPSSPS